MNPIEFGRSRGYADPVVFPEGYVEGPILVSGLLDYDAAAAVNVINLKTGANYLDPEWQHVFGTDDNPEVTLHIQGIELRLIDAAILTTDPEAVVKALDKLYLEVEQGSTKIVRRITSLGAYVPFEATNELDSDLATLRTSYAHERRGIVFTAPIRVDLKSAKSAAIKSQTPGSDLGADSVVRAFIHGYAFKNQLSNGEETSLEKACQSDPAAALTKTTEQQGAYPVFHMVQSR